MSYFVVSWDISSHGQTWAEIDQRLRDCISSLPYFKPVNTFYLVRVTSPLQHRWVLKRMQEIAGRSLVPVKFAMSPILRETDWDGWLDPGQWIEVKKITGELV